MHKVRRAFFMAMLEQHLGIAINLALIAIVSRLLSPAEVGFAVIGYGVTSVIFAFREFVSSDFLIQLDVVERDDINTSLTLLLLVSGILGIVLYLCGPYLAIFYHQPGLEHYLILAIAAVMAESLGMPAFSMLRRRLAFGTIARVRTIGLVAMAVVTIFAASNGSGFVSFALGLLVGNSVASALAAYADPAQRTARLSLKSWRRMADFGRYRGAATIVDKLYESLPQLVLGFAMTPTAVAIYNRANTVCSIPDRIFLSAIFSFAFPALAAEVREGGDVRRSYLRALSYITVLYWPSLIMVAILADPIVRLALGDQWLAAVPITRILALASIFWFPMVLTTPLLIALNANREAFLGNFVCRSVSAIVLCSASFFGLTAAFFSKAKFSPLQLPGSLDYSQAPGGWWGKWASTRTVGDIKTYLKTAKPNLLFVHLPDPDTAGHSSGWMSEAYGRAVHDTDKALDDLLDAADEAYGKDNYSVVVTADHGGHGYGHGTSDPLDVTIPWIAWGRGVDSGEMEDVSINTFDTAPTVLWMLGVAKPEAWDGVPVVKAFRALEPIAAD